MFLFTSRKKKTCNTLLYFFTKKLNRITYRKPLINDNCDVCLMKKKTNLYSQKIKFFYYYSVNHS